MSAPLDQRFIVSNNPKTGKQERIPALHPQWKQDVQFVLYQPPPLNLTNGAAYEEWMERASFIETDLHWLLKLTHDKFWCQVVFDETLQNCVDSFLRQAPRSFDLLEDLPAQGKVKQEALSRLFFMTCLRMATYKESKECHITPKVFGEILYENFILDIPKIMDLCVLYGAANGPLVSKMIANIFTEQPRYLDDLATVVPTVLQVFDNILNKCGLQIGASLSPQKLTPDSTGKPVLQSMSVVEFQDIVLYFADTSATLWAFLDMYPAGAKVFQEHDFPLRLVMMYESLVPALNEAFKERDWGALALKPALKTKLRITQGNLLKIFRQIVFQVCLSPVIEERSEEDIETVTEQYIHLVTSILGERRFTAHYDHLFPFDEDKDLLSQASYSIDDTRLHFMEQGFAEARDTYGKKKKRKTTPVAPTSDFSRLTLEGAEAGGEYEAPDYRDDEGACAARVTGIELESLISSVKDLLPDLGEGFIELCLEEYNYDMEKVINGLLEERLPPALQELDRTMPRQQSPIREEDLLSERANVFDNDEFDVYHRKDVDLSRIHKGKKEKGLTMGLLDDKEELSQVKELFDRYGSEDVDSMYDKHLEYDDEYDDTYDDNNVGADDADSADELTSRKLLKPDPLEERRPFTVPRVLIGSTKTTDHSWASQDNPDMDSESSRSREAFCEDPAKVRERQAQKRATQIAQRRQGQGQGQGHPRADVKGKAKGQGQEADVLRNRANKEKNKSTRVHHNRKNLADKKRRV